MKGEGGSTAQLVSEAAKSCSDCLGSQDFLGLLRTRHSLASVLYTSSVLCTLGVCHPFGFRSTSLLCYTPCRSAVGSWNSFVRATVQDFCDPS